MWVKQFESLPELGFRCIAFDSRGHGDSTAGSSGHSVENLADDVRTVVEAPRTSTTSSSSDTRWAASRCRPSCSTTPTSPPQRVRGMVLLSTFARLGLGGSALLRRLAEQATGRGPAANQVMAQPNLGFLLAAHRLRP